MYKKTCGVIGAGIAGLAAAIRLANKGYEVTIMEANAYPGGKLSQIELQDFRFDAGPSLFTMPHLVDELFQITQKDPRKYFNYKSLDVLCKYFYEDGTVLRAYKNLEKFETEVAQNTYEAPQKVREYLRNSRVKYDLTANIFLHRSLHRWQNYLKWDVLKGVLNFYRLDTMRSLDALNRKRFEDPRMVQFFNRYATYNGSDPYQTPGIMNIIPHLEFGYGAFFPQGGMYAITQSLEKLALDMGVRFLYNTKAVQIQTQGREVKGIEFEKEGKTQSMNFDIVLSNMDVVSTYRHLLKGHRGPKKVLNQTKSSSAIIFYWGVKAVFPELELHNIFFSQSYAQEFASIFKKGSLHEDPTVYINISSKENPSDAPPGAENWFTMINAPHNSGQDWDTLIAQSRERIIHKLSRILKKDIRPLIVCEEILDPRRIFLKTASDKGALYGSSSNNRFAAFFRHPNFSSRIKNLYFCGGSVHPGGGIPLCLHSAKIATDFL